MRLHKSSKNDYICNIIARIMEKKEQRLSISDWIDEKVMRGYYTFTIEEVKRNFPQFSDAYTRT